jgi:nitroreductase
MKETYMKSPTFSEFLASRRSTRDFLPDEVSSEIIDELLRDALTAPSWSNTRPFKVAIATGDRRDRISEEFQRRWTVLSKALRGSLWDKIKLAIFRQGLPTSNWKIAKPYVPELRPRAERVGKELYEMIGIERGDRKARDQQWGKNYQFFGAPVAIFIYFHKSLDVFAASDAGLMLENLILSAHSRGLGTCLQGAVNVWDDAIRSEFEIPKDYRLLCGLALGYPSDAKINGFKANRLDPAEIKFKAK